MASCLQGVEAVEFSVGGVVEAGSEVLLLGFVAGVEQFIDQSVVVVVTGMSKIAVSSRGLARAFQQRQRCLLCRLPSVALEVSDRRPAPTKATPLALVSTVFGHCETQLRKCCRDHDATFAKTSGTGSWRKRRPRCWFPSFSEKKVVKQSSVQVQT